MDASCVSVSGCDGAFVCISESLEETLKVNAFTACLLHSLFVTFV